MDRVRGLTCRACGRAYPTAPAHVCEFCFGPLDVDYDYAAIRPLVICITGNGLKTPDALPDRMSVDVTIRPSPSMFDQARADLKSRTGEA